MTVSEKQPLNRLVGHVTIMLAQLVEQMGAGHDVAILASLAATNVREHSTGVYISDLKMRELLPVLLRSISMAIACERSGPT